MYIMVKHIHLTAVALSILLFVFRFVWSRFDATILAKKWVKVVPHIIDTILLVSAISLCVMMSQYPIVNTWLTYKVVGVVAYILLGLFALKKAKSRAGQWLCFIAALGVLGATALVAITKQPLF